MNLLAITFEKEKNHSKQWMATVLFSMMILGIWVISLLTLGFNLALFFIAMTCVAGLLFVTPQAGLAVIILATMWFQRWFTLQPIIFGDITIKLYPLDIAFLATIIGIFFHQIFGKRKMSLPLKKIEGVLLVFLFLSALYLGRAFLDGLADTALAISAFKNYAFYALLYFLVTLTITNLVELKRMIKVFLVGGWGIIGFVLIGFIRGQGLWTEYNPLSTEGVRLLSFPHAFYLSVVMIMTIILLLYRLRPERTTVFTMWIQFLGVIGSLMRHLWLALFLTTTVLFVILPKKAKRLLLRFFAKNAAMVFFFAVIMAFIFVIFPQSETVDRLEGITDPLYNRARSLAQSTADSSARWRFFAWNAAKESIIEAPLFGVGYGKELTIEFDTYRIVVPMRELHNSLLVLLVQMGILGLLVFLYLLWLLFRPVYSSWRSRGIFFPYHAAFFAAILVFMISSFTQPYFETNFTGIFFWILMGLLVVSLRLEETEVKELANTL